MPRKVRKKMEIDSAENRIFKEKLLDKLSKESLMVVSTAYAYAKNYVNYGCDITKAWSTTVEQAAILERVRLQTQYEVYNDLKEDYDADLKSDMLAILDKMRAEIENHCGLAKEDHCKYCSRCLSMMGVREILELIDKYKVLSCNPLKTNEEEEE